MPSMRLAIRSCVWLTALAVCAQSTDPSTEPKETTFNIRVTNIVVPVTVHDRDGNTVNALQPREFHVTDNGKEQNIAVDATYHPISLAIVVQANAAVEAILPQVRKVGSMLESLVVGDQGEAAVLAFDHRMQVKQDFTSDVSKISEALKKINPGSST